MASFLVIEDFSNINAECQFDSVAGIPYPLSDDLALIALNKIVKPFVKAMKIAERVEESGEIHIVGFPKAPTHLNYC